MKTRAQQVYLYFRVYQHYLHNHNLEDDSDSITVDELVSFVETQIEEEQREELFSFCQRAY